MKINHESHEILESLSDSTDSYPESKVKSEMALMPSVNSAAVVDAFQASVFGKDPDLLTLIKGLENTFIDVHKSDQKYLEEMLVGQAIALQTIFTSLARRASAQDKLLHYQTYLNLALKSQAQSRATISALGDLKSPRHQTFVQQTNLSTGPQQVNNVINPSLQGMKVKNTPNQQSEGSNELRKDTRAQSLEGGVNSSLEALGRLDRAKVPRRKGTLS